MEQLFTVLTQAVYSTPAVALGASFIWGILSILLSPCHLSSIPLIVGFIGSQGQIKTKRAFILALLFSLGILITIGLIGLITGMLGKMLGDIGKFGNYFVAGIFFIVGLYLLGILPLPFLGKAATPSIHRKGYVAAFFLGLIFGIALGPCTFAYMMPILGVAFAIASTKFLFAVSLIFAYALGHCSVIVAAGTMTELVQKYLNWNEKSKALDIVKKICGGLVILGGVYLVFAVR
jgi:cytochrome c-type biogenesis protein